MFDFKPLDESRADRRGQLDQLGRFRICDAAGAFVVRDRDRPNQGGLLSPRGSWRAQRASCFPTTVSRSSCVPITNGLSARNNSVTKWSLALARFRSSAAENTTGLTSRPTAICELAKALTTALNATSPTIARSMSLCERAAPRATEPNKKATSTLSKTARADCRTGTTPPVLSTIDLSSGKIGQPVLTR